ncbi:hypothetical protein LIER_08958 [Lithospermum erythrorhizon]|uniref:GAG-pre-integrase domain-containing protein n=1 Tax=Lithospermum erythrorhizon TaxID=34254 RepID=A0AAV3PGT4_LITER
MQGTRSSNNCYLWDPEKTQRAMTIRHDDNATIWHRKLGHTNFRNLQQLISKNAVKGLPQLEVKEKTCGDCQVGKQTRVSHQELSLVTTTRILELLHMDLMGPVQVESIGGKKNSRALRVYNKRTKMIMESINVKVVDEEEDDMSDTEIEDLVTPVIIDNNTCQKEEGLDVNQFENLRLALGLCTIDK